MAAAATVIGAHGGVAILASETRAALTGAKVAALGRAVDTLEARIACADGRVHRNLVAVVAHEAAVRAHETLGAVAALRRIDTTKTHALVVAVWRRRAVWNLAARANPALLAKALLRFGVAHAMVGAVDANAGAALTLTQLAPPARIALTLVAETFTVV
jgi:hypothetical protein